MRSLLLFWAVFALLGCGCVEKSTYEIALRRVGPYSQVYVYNTETDIEKCPLKDDRLVSFQAVDEQNQRVCRQACCSMTLRFCELRAEQVCGAW